MAALCVGTMIPGPRGEDGVNGLDGADGIDGVEGPEGPAGADGSLTGAAGGDLLGSTYPNPIIAPLVVTSAKMSATGVVAGVYGSSTLIPVITVDAAGRLTLAVDTALVAGGAPSGSAGPPGDLIGTYPDNLVVDAGKITTAKLAVTGVGAGTYGSGSAIPVVTLGVDGRVTAISTIAPVFTGVVPTASNLQVVGSGAAFAVPGSGIYVDVDFGGADPTLALAAAGTYLILATIGYTPAASGVFDVGARFYDTTAAAPLIGAPGYASADAVTPHSGQLTLSAVATVGAGHTIVLQVLRTLTGFGTVGVDIIAARTSISYIRLA